MTKVVCTVVLVLGSGWRQVLSHEPGQVLKEGHSGYNETLLVDFPGLPQLPTARWVHENDCLYLQQSQAETDNEAKNSELADKLAEEDKAKWAALNRKLLRSKGK